MHSRHVVFLSLTLLAAGCSTEPSGPPALRYKLNGPLIPARMTMVTAWDFPRNPLTDATLDDSKLSKEIRLGYEIFTNTPQNASRFTPGRMSCNNCHLNGGQREKSLPLDGIAGQFPEYNRRAGRLFSLDDRIVDCFVRSQNATGRLADGAAESSAALPTADAREVLALSAYLTWISKGVEVGGKLWWRGQNAIPVASLIPVAQLDPAKGEAIFMDRCSNCHGKDGQGVMIGDKRAGPLWGPDSWNDGAGAARIYTLAGIIRYAMPYLDPGNMSDADAQQLAAFITSKPRPSYPFKDRDYLSAPLPPDAVYYPGRDAASADSR